MSTNEKNVDQTAAIEAAKTLYQEAAGTIGKGADAIERGRGGVWSGFKKALRVAASHGHTKEVMVAALSAACADAEVPAGSLRSYMPTASSLLDDINAGKLAVEDIDKMSIQEARKRYAKPRGARQTGQGGKDDEAVKVSPEVATAVKDSTSAKDRALLSALMRAWIKLSGEQREELVQLAESYATAPADEDQQDDRKAA